MDDRTEKKEQSQCRGELQQAREAPYALEAELNARHFHEEVEFQHQRQLHGASGFQSCDPFPHCAHNLL